MFIRNWTSQQLVVTQQQMMTYKSTYQFAMFTMKEDQGSTLVNTRKIHSTA